jgi:hypothetical protein
MNLLTREEAARILGISAFSLYSRQVRSSLGLPCVRVGSRIRFRPEDIQRVIDRGLEMLVSKRSRQKRAPVGG